MVGRTVGLFAWRSRNKDEESWTTECRNCGGSTVDSNFCSDECSLEHWEQQERSSGRDYNTNPNGPACGGSGSCKLCKDDD